MLGTTHSGLSGTTTSMCVRSRAVASNSFVNTENLTQNSSIDKRSALGLGVGGSPPLLPHGAFWNTGGDTLPRPGQCRLVRSGARTWQVMRPCVDNVACTVCSPLPLRGPWGREQGPQEERSLHSSWFAALQLLSVPRLHLPERGKKSTFTVTIWGNQAHPLLPRVRG